MRSSLSRTHPPAKRSSSGRFLAQSRRKRLRSSSLSVSDIEVIAWSVFCEEARQGRNREMEMSDSMFLAKPLVRDLSTAAMLNIKESLRIRSSLLKLASCETPGSFYPFLWRSKDLHISSLDYLSGERTSQLRFVLHLLATEADTFARDTSRQMVPWKYDFSHPLLE
jgi:hypothetical protein